MCYPLALKNVLGWTDPLEPHPPRRRVDIKHCILLVNVSDVYDVWLALVPQTTTATGGQDPVQVSILLNSKSYPFQVMSEDKYSNISFVLILLNQDIKHIPIYPSKLSYYIPTSNISHYILLTYTYVGITTRERTELNGRNERM